MDRYPFSFILDQSHRFVEMSSDFAIFSYTFSFDETFVLPQHTFDVFTLYW